MIYILGDGGLAEEARQLINRDRWYSRETVLVGKDGEDALSLNPGGLDELIIAIGSTEPRMRLSEKFAGGRWRSIIGSDMHGCVVGEGTMVARGVLATTGITIGKHCLINLGVTLGHGVQIGDCCVVNPNASISGNVTIGRGTFVGSHACIVENLHIGAGCFVTAGSIVTQDLADGERWVGNAVGRRPRLDGLTKC